MILWLSLVAVGAALARDSASSSSGEGASGSTRLPVSPVPAPPSSRMGGMSSLLGVRGGGGMDLELGIRQPQGGYGAVSPVSGHRGSGAMEPRTGARRAGYGILPLLGVAGVEVAELAWAGAGIGEALSTLEALAPWLAVGAGSGALDAITHTTASGWGIDSDVWQAETAKIWKAVRAAGRTIPLECAWVLSGQTRIRRLAQVADEVLEARGSRSAGIELINDAWKTAESLMPEVVGTGTEALAQALGIPAMLGALTRMVLASEIWWTSAFFVALRGLGVTDKEFAAIRDRYSRMQGDCARAIGGTEKGWLRKLFRYFWDTDTFRKGLVKKIVTSVAPAALAGGFVGEIALDAAKHGLKVMAGAEDDSGIWHDLHDALEVTMAETTGQMPAGSALWRADEMEAYLVGDDGTRYPEGLIPAGRYKVMVRVKALQPPTPVLFKGKPMQIDLLSGRAYTLYDDRESGQFKIRAEALRTSPGGASASPA